MKIADIVADILNEEKDDSENKDSENKESEKKDNKRKSSGPGIEASTGSGRYSRGVSEAGALAKEDPKKLMKDLDISSAGGSNDMEKIENLLKQALTGHGAMKRVYVGLSKISASGEKPEALRIKTDLIKVRDSVKYLYHTLVGAQNAGILKLDSLIQIENFKGEVIIYQGAKRSYGS